MCDWFTYTVEVQIKVFGAKQLDSLRYFIAMILQVKVLYYGAFL